MTPPHDPRTRGQAYRARMEAEARGLDATITQEQWEATIAAFDGCCAYCDEPDPKLCLDHFIPLVRGGPSVYGNCIPACRRCNREKGCRDPHRPGFWAHFPDARQDQILAFAGDVQPGPWEPTHYQKHPVMPESICGLKGVHLVGASQSVTCDVCAQALELRGFRVKR